MIVRKNSCRGVAATRDPGYFVGRVLYLAEQLGCQDVVVLVILYEKNFQFVFLHSSFPSGGSSTSSNQYLPMVLITSTIPSNVTGLMMNEFTPRSYVRKTSSSAFDVVSTTIGMLRSSGSLLISFNASRPSLRGILRSSRMRLGRGRAASPENRPRL